MSFHKCPRPLALLTTCFLVFASGAFAQTESAPIATDDGVQKAVAAIDALAQKQIDEKQVVGLSIAVVHKDKVIFAKGYGLRQVGKPEKVDPDTVFQLASVSKPIGASVVASLIGDGKINWDSKISNLDPGFEMYDSWVTRQLTLRDMYCHRSGLPGFAGDLLEDMGYDRAQVLHQLRFLPPVSSFRSQYAYTNFGLTEAAVAAAKAYGMTWEDASQAKLYGPVGMKSTSSLYSDFVGRSDKAELHVLENGQWVQKFHRDPEAQSPAGGCSSSVNDLAQWMRLQLANGKLDGKQIVPEQPLLETRRPQMFLGFSPLDGHPGFYGLGMDVNYDVQAQMVLSHSGGFDMGAATCVRFIPAQQLGIIVLTNCYPIGVAEALAANFFDFAMYGKSTHDWFPLYKKALAAFVDQPPEFDFSKPPALVSPPSPNSAYVGTYDNDYVGDIVIMEKNGKLTLTLGPRKMTFPMKHFNRDIFTYETVGENAIGRTGIRFLLDDAGRAQTVTINYLNKFGLGVFNRVSEAK